MCQQWPVTKARALGAADLAMAQALLEDVTINLTIEQPELTGLGKQTFGGHKQNFVCTRNQEKGAMTPKETDPDLAVSVQWRCESAVGCCRVRDTECDSVFTRHFEGGLHYLHYLHHSLASGQTIGREHSPTHQQKIGLKVY